MKLYSKAVLCFLLVVLVSAAGAAWCATRIQDGDPGTIGECLTRADGSLVTLKGEHVIWRGGSGKSFAIKEWFEKCPGKPRLVVISTRPLPVEAGWSVDVTGALRTFPETTGGRQRVILVRPEDVKVHCNLKGRPCPFLGLKEDGHPSIIKRPLTEMTGQTVSAMDSGEPPLLPDPPDSPPPAPGSRDTIKWLPDGAPVSVNGAIVSAAFYGYGFFYVERQDRSFGIWISAQDYVSEGQLLDITGRMGTGGGERAVVADQNGISVLDYDYPRPTEVGMPNNALGGGAVGLYTPAVADAAGLNNTGLLVRAWGKVTAVDTENRMFYIDDGSSVTADAQQIGVKVYDLTYDSLPSVNEYVTLSGVSAAEWPQGSETSIRVIWKTASVTPATQSGSGTISGTMTATGADGKRVRVYCASASATATFSGNTANYSLSVPYGDHAVTASLLGYKTTTQLATVSSSTPVDLDFTLTTLYKLIDVVPSEPRIAPDGVSETVVTAIVRDEEGRRIGDESITWDVDLGTLVDSESSTNAVGEATATIRSSTNHETATVTAQVGSLVGYGWVEYGNPDDPSILPVSPYIGETLSGGVYITYWFYTPYGGTEAIPTIEVFVDSQSIGFMSSEDPNAYWETFTLANGTHTVHAQATDSQGNTMYSPITTVQTDNYVNALQVTPDEFDPGIGEQATISASLEESVNWELTIKDTNGSNTVYTTTGTGSSVSCTWNGATALSEDLFQYTVTATSGSQSGASATGWVGKKVIPDSAIQVLSTASPNLKYWAIRVAPMYDYAKQRGFLAKKLPPKKATWARISSILSYGNCRMLYLNCHSSFAETTSPGGTTYYRTWLNLDRQVLSYRIPSWPTVAIEDLGLENSDQMRFVWLDGCSSGYYGITTGTNDMAQAFGMYSYSNMMMGDQTYCGWMNASGDPPMHYQDWCRELLYYFKDSGRPLDRAIFLAYWSDTSEFDYIYNHNFITYGGDYYLSLLTTFFEVY